MFLQSLLPIIQTIFWLPSLAHQYLPFLSVTDKRLLSAVLRLIKVHSIACLNVGVFKSPCQMCLACGAGLLRWWVSASSAMLLLMAGRKVPGRASGRKSLGLTLQRCGFSRLRQAWGWPLHCKASTSSPPLWGCRREMGGEQANLGCDPTEGLSAQGRNAAANTWHETLTWQHCKSRFTGGD